jgi:hypothetical protein
VEKFDAVMACLESAACGAALTQTDQIGANVLLAKRVRLTISRWAQLMLMMGRQLLERLVGGRNHMSSLSFLQGSRLAVRVDRGDEAQQRNEPPARLRSSTSYYKHRARRDAPSTSSIACENSRSPHWSGAGFISDFSASPRNARPD